MPDRETEAAACDMDAVSDLELLHQVRDGSWDAFEKLVASFEPRVFGLTFRMLRQRQDAEDATQQTFLSVLEHLERFREESSVATWVLRIATNHSLKIIRKRAGLPLESSTGTDTDQAPLPRPAYIAQWHDDPVDLAQRAEVRELLTSALDELDEKYRLVFVLRDIEGHSTREVAELLEITSSNVKIRLLRARLQLREQLTQALGDESTRVIPPKDHH